MKTKISKLFLVVLLITSIALGSSITFAQESDNTADVSSRDKIISKLLNAGFTTEQINDLPESELLTYKDGEIVSADKKYYRITSKKKEKEVTDNKTGKKKVVYEPVEETREVTELTKDQCMYEVQEYKKKHDESKKEKNVSMTSSGISKVYLAPMGSYDNGSTWTNDADGWISVSIVALYQGGTKYKLSASYGWLTDPQYTQTDVLGLGHDAGLTQTNDPVTSYFKNDWTNGWVSPFSGTDTNTTPREFKNDTGGAVVSYTLNSRDVSANGGYIRTNYRGYMSYYANVNSTSIRYVSIYGTYAHQQTTFAISPSISWPLSLGFSVSSPTKFDFLSPNPYMSIHVNY